MTILWSVGPAPRFHHQVHIPDIFLMYVLHMPLVGCWILCMRCAHYIEFFMFCGPGQHSGYSDYLWASPVLWYLPPPLSSAEVKESVELYLYTPCRPWMPFVRWNLFFTFSLTFMSVWGQGSMVSIVTILLAGWSWVQILVGTKDFSPLQNIQTSFGAHTAFYIWVQGFFPGIKVART